MIKDFSDISCKVTFNKGPRIEIYDNHSSQYLLELYEKFGDEWAMIYSDHHFGPNNWYQHSKSFRTEWKLKVWGIKNELPILLTQHTYNEKNKKVLLRFDYPDYKIQKNWFLKSVEFMNKTSCELYIESKFKHRLDKDFTSNVKIIETIDNIQDFWNNHNIYATYTIGRHEIQSKSYNLWESDGIFENHAHHYKSFDHKNDWVKLSNEELINDILGL